MPDTPPEQPRIDREQIARAAELLRSGALVAFPTETVYGLGADATNGTAVAGIFAAKNRPSFNPLIAHVPDLAAARKLVIFDAMAERLATRFWPGALTLVLPRRDNCPVAEICSAGLDTLAVRVPAGEIAQTLLRAVGRPVAAPSANPSGRLSPTTAAHVISGLGDRVAMVLDGGPCAVGVESTVVGIFDGRAVLLRPGGLAVEEIETVTGPLSRPSGDPDAPASPGMLASHYAPESALRLNATSAMPGETLLGFGPDAPPGPNLSRSGDLAEAAANLFQVLHSIDRGEAGHIAVMPIPHHGLGLAINDRLTRAAAPRDG
ncbi:MAG: L-threonylcarbamoyladenylate synthase [Minwuia sp.]|nr:L-threonylcarbamoyladenylate synthase [Minwuia sp.]